MWVSTRQCITSPSPIEKPGTHTHTPFQLGPAHRPLGDRPASGCPAGGSTSRAVRPAVDEQAVRTVPVPPLRVLLGAFGDPGHAFPMIALGRALAARGHEVTLQT